MKFYLAVMITLALVATGSGQQKKKKVGVNCDREAMDKCSNNLLMLGDPTFVFPLSMDAMSTRCKKLKGLERCVKDYTENCMSRESKQPIAVLAYGITRTNKGYCNTNKRREAFIGIGKCVTPHRKILDDYMETMNREFHAIKSTKIANQRIPMACCSYYKMKQKILGKLSTDCEVISEVEALLDGYAQDILNLVCGDYTEDSDKCDVFKNKIPVWKKPLLANNFILPLADIFNSL